MTISTIIGISICVIVGTLFAGLVFACFITSGINDYDEFYAFMFVGGVDGINCIFNFISSWGIAIRGNNMKLTEFMDNKYQNRKDKDNIFCVGISDAEFRTFIIDYLLGEDWYVTDPLGQTQVNERALYTILKIYSKRYRKECRESEMS